MLRRRHASVAVAALMMWPGAAALAQATDEVQETVRVSVAGTIVELPIEQAAEVCGLDLETLRADVAALEAGAGDPVSAEEMGATDVAGTEPAEATTEAGAGTEANTAASGDVAADGTMGVEAIDSDAATTNDNTAMLDDDPAAGAGETDPDATTTNDDTAMADDGTTAGVVSTDTVAEAEVAGDTAQAEDEAVGAEGTAQAGDSAPQVESPDTAVVDNAEMEAAADPEVPLPTADAVCEIDRDTAEELNLAAPD